MRTMRVIAIASVLGLGIGLAGAQPATTELQQFQKHGVAVNQRAASSPQYLAAALHTISVQTGVPLATVQAQHKQYPNVGVIGLMAANVLADETKKEPAVFLQAKAGGQTWPQIAQAYNVPLAKLNTRLARMEQLMEPAGGGQPATTGLKGFEQQSVSIDQRAASSPENLTGALNAISVQTGVPLATVQEQHRQYPNIGVAGLLAANVLADQTKKDPTVFLQAKASGQTWPQIAQANNVPMTNLDTRLANVEQSMAPMAQYPQGGQPATTGQQGFEQRAAAIDQRAASSPENLTAALNAISVQTGVPLATVQEQHKQYPNIGVAGLLAANVLADQTKKDPTVFLQANASGQTWSRIAQSNNVPVANLDTRLANVEQSVAPTGR